jgi:hypothetical protein
MGHTNHLRELRQNIKILKLYTHGALHQRTIKIEVITGEMKFSVWYQHKKNKFSHSITLDYNSVQCRVSGKLSYYLPPFRWVLEELRVLLLKRVESGESSVVMHTDGHSVEVDNKL